jgi:hypothetical protein
MNRLGTRHSGHPVVVATSNTKFWREIFINGRDPVQHKTMPPTTEQKNPKYTSSFFQGWLDDDNNYCCAGGHPLVLVAILR